MSRSWKAVLAAVGAVVLVTVTVAVAPTLAGFGARPDNPTLLDRPYAQGWLVYAAVVVAGGVLGTTVGRAARSRRSSRTHPSARRTAPTDGVPDTPERAD
jgi:hypothetical protein